MREHLMRVSNKEERCGKILVLDKRTTGNYDGSFRRVKCLKHKNHDARDLGIAASLCAGIYRYGFLWQKQQSICWDGGNYD